jgi:3-oxoacyl-[acyl-carrier protein] reductase
MTFPLSNRVALITGITGAVGKALAKNCMASGVKVYGTYFSREKEAESLRRNGISVFKIDHRNLHEVQQSSEEILKELKHIDILINNAGATLDRMNCKMEESEWDDVLAVNLTASFLWTKAVLKPMMQQRYGRIVMVSSRVGIKGAIGASNYTASKAGLIGLAKSVAKEMGRYNILVNVVCPGFIKSRITEILPNVCWDQAAQESVLGRYGDVEEVARFITYLVSDEVQGVSGQVFSWDSRI